MAPGCDSKYTVKCSATSEIISTVPTHIRFYISLGASWLLFPRPFRSMNPIFFLEESSIASLKENLNFDADGFELSLHYCDTRTHSKPLCTRRSTMLRKHERSETWLRGKQEWHALHVYNRRSAYSSCRVSPLSLSLSLMYSWNYN